METLREITQEFLTEAKKNDNYHTEELEKVLTDIFTYSNKIMRLKLSDNSKFVKRATKMSLSELSSAIEKLSWVSGFIKSIG